MKWECFLIHVDKGGERGNGQQLCSIRAMNCSTDMLLSAVTQSLQYFNAECIKLRLKMLLLARLMAPHTINIKNYTASVSSSYKGVFPSIRVSGFSDGHPMDSSFHYIMISFLVLIVYFNAILVPASINFIFIDFKFNLSSLFLNYLYQVK